MIYHISVVYSPAGIVQRKDVLETIVTRIITSVLKETCKKKGSPGTGAQIAYAGRHIRQKSVIVKALGNPPTRHT